MSKIALRRIRHIPRTATELAAQHGEKILHLTDATSLNLSQLSANEWAFISYLYNTLTPEQPNSFSDFANKIAICPANAAELENIHENLEYCQTTEQTMALFTKLRFSLQGAEMTKATSDIDSDKIISDVFENIRLVSQRLLKNQTSAKDSAKTIGVFFKKKSGANDVENTKPSKDSLIDELNNMQAKIHHAFSVLGKLERDLQMDKRNMGQSLSAATQMYEQQTAVYNNLPYYIIALMLRGTDLQDLIDDYSELHILMNGTFLGLLKMDEKISLQSQSMDSECKNLQESIHMIDEAIGKDIALLKCYLKLANTIHAFLVYYTKLETDYKISAKEMALWTRCINLHTGNEELKAPDIQGLQSELENLDKITAAEDNRLQKFTDMLQKIVEEIQYLSGTEEETSQTEMKDTSVVTKTQKFPSNTPS